jgi:hypothetical protein
MGIVGVAVDVELSDLDSAVVSWRVRERGRGRQSQDKAGGADHRGHEELEEASDTHVPSGN